GTDERLADAPGDGPPVEGELRPPAGPSLHGRTPTCTGSVEVAVAPAIRLRSAVALLGRFPALAGVDLDVAAGEIVLLEGPNGAGKTTLLRACAGLVPVIDGEASVLGHDLRRDRRSVRRHVALLGHASGLYDDLTVADNLRFVARATRTPGGASVYDTLTRLR